MIRIQLSGRLGNQLFQLAHGLAMATELKKNLYVFYDDIHLSKSEVNDLRAVGVDGIVGNRIHRRNDFGLLLKLLDKIRATRPGIESKLCQVLKIYREHDEKVSVPFIISGYFQDQVYAEAGLPIIERIVLKKGEDVSIDFVSNLPVNYQVFHYRRGDFVGHPNNFGTLDPQFYINNMDRDLPIVVLTDSYKVAINDFSDLKNLKVANPSEIDPWMALNIMSKADVVIGSNSTLSWWGCFLAVRNGASAVLPKPFYLNNMNENLYHPDFKFRASIFSEKQEL